MGITRFGLVSCLRLRAGPQPRSATERPNPLTLSLSKGSPRAGKRCRRRLWAASQAAWIRVLLALATGALVGLSAPPKATLAATPMPVRLVFTSAPSIVVVGQIGTFTVQRQDSSARPVTGGSLFVSVESANREQFSDPTTGTALPEWDKDDHRVAITIPAGGSTASVGYKPLVALVTDTIAARAVFNGVSLTPATATVDIKAGPATKLAFDNLVGSPARPRGPGWVLKYNDDGTPKPGSDSLKSLVIEVQDAFENKNQGAAPSIIVTTSSSTGRFALDSSGCDGDGDFRPPGASLTGTASAGELRVCYLDTTPGVATIRASAAGFADAKIWVNVTANRLAIKPDPDDLTGPASLIEGNPSPPYTLSFGDADGDGDIDADDLPDVDIIIGLIVTEGLKRVRTASFHKIDGTKLGVVSKYAQLPVKKGAASTQFTLKDTDPDPDTHVVHAVLGGEYPTIREGKINVKILPLAPDHLTFGERNAKGDLVAPSPPQTMTAGSTSGTMIVQLRDSDGNFFTSTRDLVVDLSSSSPTGAFYDSLGITKVEPSQIILRNGTTSVAFAYRDTTGGHPTISAATTWASKTVAGTQQQLIIGGPPRKLAITTAPHSADVGQTTGVITVQLQDDKGVPTDTERDLLVALSTTSGDAVFRDAMETANITFVTIAAGKAEASFRYRDQGFGTPIIAVQASALAGATQQLTIGADAPVPVLPISIAGPPNTPPPPAFLSEVPRSNMSVGFFGPSAVVEMLRIPVLRPTPFAVGCWSGPNATTDEASHALLHGTRPAHANFIYFFIRGTRSYVYDVSAGDYCWVDLT